MPKLPYQKPDKTRIEIDTEDLANKLSAAQSRADERSQRRGGGGGGGGMGGLGALMAQGAAFQLLGAAQQIAQPLSDPFTTSLQRSMAIRGAAIETGATAAGAAAGFAFGGVPGALVGTAIGSGAGGILSSVLTAKDKAAATVDEMMQQFLQTEADFRVRNRIAPMTDEEIKQFHSEVKPQLDEMMKQRQRVAKYHGIVTGDHRDDIQRALESDTATQLSKSVIGEGLFSALRDGLFDFLQMLQGTTVSRVVQSNVVDSRTAESTDRRVE